MMLLLWVGLDLPRWGWMVGGIVLGWDRRLVILSALEEVQRRGSSLCHLKMSC